MSRTAPCPDEKPYQLVVFDVQRPGALERLVSESAAWGEGTTVEPLGPCHAALVIRAGGAARLQGTKQT
jgi:hypothetical protein